MSSSRRSERPADTPSGPTGGNVNVRPATQIDSGGFTCAQTMRWIVLLAFALLSGRSQWRDKWIGQRTPGWLAENGR